MEKKLAIIILNYNSFQLTKKLIATLNANIKASISYEIIVIDNNSKNESFIELSKFKKVEKFILLSSQDNGGYAKGNNIGLKYAYNHGFSFGWILNNDIEFKNNDLDFLSDIFSFFYENMNTAAVYTGIVTPEQVKIAPFVERPTFYDLTVGAYFYRKKRYKSMNKKEPFKIYKGYGCSIFLNMKHINECNYLDENTFLYLEEDILAEKLIQYDLDTYYLPNINIVHNHSTTVSNEIKKTKINNIVSKSYKYYLKEYRHYNKLQIVICLLIQKIKWSI